LVVIVLYVEEKVSFQCSLLGNAAESVNEWEGKMYNLIVHSVHRSLRAVVF
jgi:hypothetical protein